MTLPLVLRGSGTRPVALRTLLTVDLALPALAVLDISGAWVGARCSLALGALWRSAALTGSPSLDSSVVGRSSDCPPQSSAVSLGHPFQRRAALALGFLVLVLHAHVPVHSLECVLPACID